MDVVESMVVAYRGSGKGRVLHNDTTSVDRHAVGAEKNLINARSIFDWPTASALDIYP